ncbi:hypothetical protein phytr_2410 [Candidatus Phycorickettsia trachydisci]|uniref:Uncharacterized protein n=1 Tax=Candidatus Phycorickettsia trachydisci TaxID=2115978 RepID=A0A2P1P7F1_9RICK|nr:ankyrin repeat domain-containing protein [Candidatus Phycorickettsia trachydisci]AVP87198.1 hypothetical protein phytr_2410 [Candidatus Phycorickettsia trachydisci]
MQEDKNLKTSDLPSPKELNEFMGGGDFDINDLVRAVKEGKIDVVKELLDLGIDVNGLDDKFFTPLQMAAKCGHYEIVELLLKKGADVDKCEVKSWEFWQSIPNRDESNRHEFTPLHWAVKHNHNHIVKLLLDSDADFYSYHGKNLICFAAQNSNKEAVKMLLDLASNSPKVDDINEYFDALYHAIYDGNTEMVELILGYGITLNDHQLQWDYTYDHMMEYIIHDIPMIDLLLRHEEISLDSEFSMQDTLAKSLGFEEHPDLNLLQIAVKRWQLETVKFLIHEKGMVYDSLNLVYHALVGKDREYDESKTLDMLKFLDEIGCDFREISEGGFMPIHSAAMCCPPAIFEYILNKGFDVNDITAPHGDSLLHLAARHGNLEIVDYLINKGVNLNVRNIEDEYPVDCVLKHFDEALEYWEGMFHGYFSEFVEQDTFQLAAKLIIAGADLTGVINKFVESRDYLLKKCSLPQKIVVLGNLLFATNDKDLYSEFTQNIELLKQKILLAGEPKMVIEMKDLFPKIKTTHTTEKDVECLCSVVSETILQNLDLFRGVMVGKMSRDILNDLRDGYITDDQLGDAMESIFPKIPERIKVLILNDSLRQDFRKDVMTLDTKAKGLKRAKNDVEPSKKAKIEDSSVDIKCLSGIVVNGSNSIIETNLEADIWEKDFVRECLGQEEGSLS